MERETVTDTGLVKISVHELDEQHIKAPPEEVNILREKTFTRELSDLVNRIFSNESVKSDNIVKNDPPDISEKNKILNDLEKIIYTLKHSEELNKTGSRYNPFNLDIDVFDDIDDMDNYLNRGISQCGFSEYGIYSYISQEGAFRFDRGTLDDYLKMNCFFGLKDYIFKNELPEQGIILTDEIIRQNPFLEKKFIKRNNKKTDNNSFYINRISSCLSTILSDRNFFNLSIIEKYTSPLIVIKLPAGTNLFAENIFTLLNSYMSIPLAVYMGKNRIVTVLNDFTFEDSLTLTDLFKGISDLTELTWCLLTCEEFSSMESFFMIKYFLSKIKSSAGIDSLVMRVSSNRIIMALPPANAEIIENITSEFNSRSSNYIDFRDITDYSLGTKNKLVEFFL